MPSPLSVSCLAFGAILTTVSDTAGVIVAGLGLAAELFRFYVAGNDGLG